MARPATVAQQVDVELQLLAARRQLEHPVVERLERRTGPEEPEARPDAGDVRVHRDVALAEREQQHARRGLAPDARQGGQAGATLLDARVREPAQVVAVELAQDRLDADGLDLGDAAGPDRRLDVVVGGVADGVPAAEALTQAQEGDVAVAVARRLREDGQDELVEPLPVRGRDGPPVDLPEPVPDAADAGARRVAHGAGPYRLSGASPEGVSPPASCIFADAGPGVRGAVDWTSV